ncbi:MAG TPA: hypothetical protein VN224_08475 [Xanthomonadales bacterium]|nr:hypothetical protein [Xanthomonadales bacterium]
MIDYQRALAQAVAGGRGAVPGVRDADVATFAEIALRKRLAALHALLPRTLAALGRAAFDARCRAFVRTRASVGPDGYRDEAIAFARALGTAAARREARVVAAYGPRASLAIVRDGRRVTVLARLRRGARLRVVQVVR